MSDGQITVFHGTDGVQLLPPRPVVKGYWADLFHFLQTGNHQRDEPDSDVLSALEQAEAKLSEHRKTGYMTGWDLALKNVQAAIAKLKASK